MAGKVSQYNGAIRASFLEDNVSGSFVIIPMPNEEVRDSPVALQTYEPLVTSHHNTIENKEI